MMDTDPTQPPGTIVRITPDGKLELILHTRVDSGLSLHDAYRLIDCQTVEFLAIDHRTGTEPMFDGEPCQMLIDEEGKLKAHVVNDYATASARIMGMIDPSDYIAGVALLLLGHARWLPDRD